MMPKGLRDFVDRQARYRQDTRHATILSVFAGAGRTGGDEYWCEIPGVKNPIKGVVGQTKRDHWPVGASVTLGFLGGDHAWPVILGGAGGPGGYQDPSHPDGTTETEGIWGELDGKVSRAGDTLSEGAVLDFSGLAAVSENAGELVLSSNEAGAHDLAEMNDIGLVLADDSDTDPDTLLDKMLAGDAVTLEAVLAGGTRKVQVSFDASALSTGGALSSGAVDVGGMNYGTLPRVIDTASIVADGGFEVVQGGALAWWIEAYGDATIARVEGDGVSGNCCLAFSDRTGTAESGILARFHTLPASGYDGRFAIDPTHNFEVTASAKRVGASDGNIVAVVIDCYDASMGALTSLVPLVWNPPTTSWAAQSAHIGPGTAYDWPAGTRYIRVKIRDSSTGTGAVNRVSAVVVKRVDYSLTGQYTITHTSNTATDYPLVVTKVDDTAAGSAIAYLIKQMAGAAADDDGPALLFGLTDTHGGPNALGSIGVARDGADNSGQMTFAVLEAGVARYQLGIRSNGRVIVGDRAQNEYDLVTLLRGQQILETTFERLLQGTLSSGNATPATQTWNFGSDATDNNSVATWNGAGWASAASYRYTQSVGQYFEITFRTTGGDVVLDRGTGIAFYDTQAAVTLDTVAQTAWNQQTNQTYTLSSVTAGVHTVRVTAVDVSSAIPNCSMAISTTAYPAYVYQGRGVASDTFTLEVVRQKVLAHTIGTGPTNNGAAIPNDYKPAISVHTPMGTTNNDTTLARDGMTPAGMTLAAATRGILHLDWVDGGSASVPFMAGDSLALSTTAATRGFRVAPTIQHSWECPSFSAAVIHDDLMCALVRITTPGAGSAFAAGDLAMFVLNRSYTAANAANFCTTGDTATSAGDLFAIPTDLL